MMQVNLVNETEKTSLQMSTKRYVVTSFNYLVYNPTLALKWVSNEWTGFHKPIKSPCDIPNAIWMVVGRTKAKERGYSHIQNGLACKMSYMINDAHQCSRKLLCKCNPWTNYLHLIILKHVWNKAVIFCIIQQTLFLTKLLFSSQ